MALSDPGTPENRLARHTRIGGGSTATRQITCGEPVESKALRVVKEILPMYPLVNIQKAIENGHL